MDDERAVQAAVARREPGLVPGDPDLLDPRGQLRPGRLAHGGHAAPEHAVREQVAAAGAPLDGDPVEVGTPVGHRRGLAAEGTGPGRTFGRVVQGPTALRVVDEPQGPSLSIP